jgi:quercetin dioxygenase-like cupin family protein
MRNLLITACSVATFIAFTAAVPALAGGEPKQTKLLNTTLDDINREVNIVLAEFGPGAETPRHLHPGNLFVYVLEGSLEVHVEGKEPQRISAGEVFQEVPDKPMLGRNVSSSDVARVIIFQIGEVGKPLTVAQPE